MRDEESRPSDETPTLTFDEFWDWLIRHPNCVLRAGSRDCVIYDDEEYHWHFAVETPDTPLVQVIRGKRLVAELFVPRDEIAYVQGGLGDMEGEHAFDLVVEGESERAVACFFVLSHSYDGDDSLGAGLTTHSIH